MIDFGLQRENMIESQVRPNGITDTRLITAMAHIPREQFVPEQLRSLAYMDEDLPIGAGRSMMEPMAFARLVQAAGLDGEDVVLEVGTGSGYSSAVIAQLVQTVVSIEEDAELAQRASDLLLELDVNNVAVLNKPHNEGCPAEAPFDAIIINGRVPLVPQALLDQLKPGGRLIAVAGNKDVSPAFCYMQVDGTISKRRLFDASISMLPGIEVETPDFVF